uniref:Uncharacterized protein n=1 Tax=Bos indicus x Bos taurus TaxID=30522 RepID=A0A4W2FDM8_BOBOX
MLGGSCRGDPWGTRQRPPERNFQSTRLPPASATSSSPGSGTGRQQMGSWPGTPCSPGLLSHSRLRSDFSMASPTGPQPTKRPTVPRGPSTATSPVSATGASSFSCAQPSSLCRCRRPAPSSTTKRLPTGSCATEHSPAATSRRRRGSSPCVKRATCSSALFSYGPESTRLQ